MRNKILKRAGDFALRLALAYLGGRLVVLGQEHQKRAQERRSLALRKSVGRHPAGRATTGASPRPVGASYGTREREARGWTGTTR
jgi:hypothetical protein